MKRDVNNKMIAGVCAGMAKHFNLDPIIVRLTFVVAFLLWGAGPLIYIIAWILMPQEDA